MNAIVSDFQTAVATTVPTWLTRPAMRRGKGTDDLRPLQQIGTRLNFARNETIFSEGDAAKSVYRLVKGSVRMCRHLADGRRQIAHFCLPGEFFGLLGMAEYTLTAEATTDSVVIAYSCQQISNLGEEAPGLRRYMLGQLCERLSAMQNHVVLLGRQTAREKMASFLVALADHAELDNGDVLDLPMSRQDVADYLGLTIETVCRLLSAFKRKSFIHVPDIHHLMMNNIEALREIALGDDGIDDV